MKITNKLLHIPPYITTTWAHVKALYMNEKTLVIALSDDSQVKVPNLPEEALNAIFTTYSTFIESEKPTSRSSQNQFIIQSESAVTGPTRSSGKFNFNAIDPSGMSMQHNPNEANTPEFPREVLDKIAAIAKIVAPEDIGAMPQAEPHCNCPHCQIARAIRSTVGHAEATIHPEQLIEAEHEEVVKEQDLDFQQWIIKQTGENLYDVTNKLDPKETYHVFLGNPVGCTCGKAGCEHMVAVLKS